MCIREGYSAVSGELYGFIEEFLSDWGVILHNIQLQGLLSAFVFNVFEPAQYCFIMIINLLSYNICKFMLLYKGIGRVAAMLECQP